jgi:hypothetical protein
MATSERLQTATLVTDPGGEMRTGGAVLFMGAALFLITIAFELIVGWPPSGDEATAADTPTFIHQHWSSLRWIWGAQMLAVFLIALSALLLLQSRHLAARCPPTSLIWSTVAVAGMILTVAFGLTLGSYPPAVRAVEENPEIFTTVRGGVRFLLASSGTVAVLGHIILFTREGMADRGLVPRSWILGMAVALVLAIMTAALGLLRPQTASAVVFFVPALLGLALWRAGRQLGPKVS